MKLDVYVGQSAFSGSEASGYGVVIVDADRECQYRRVLGLHIEIKGPNLAALLGILAALRRIKEHDHEIVVHTNNRCAREWLADDHDYHNDDVDRARAQISGYGNKVTIQHKGRAFENSCEEYEEAFAIASEAAKTPGFHLDAMREQQERAKA